jgi:hypothetical protein
MLLTRSNNPTLHQAVIGAMLYQGSGTRRSKRSAKPEEGHRLKKAGFAATIGT